MFFCEGWKVNLKTDKFYKDNIKYKVCKNEESKIRFCEKSSSQNWLVKPNCKEVDQTNEGAEKQIYQRKWDKKSRSIFPW